MSPSSSNSVAELAAFETVKKLAQKRKCHSGTACKAGPGNHEHLFSRVFTGLCSLIPGSRPRAAGPCAPSRGSPAPRKETVLEFPDDLDGSRTSRVVSTHWFS